ncbi:MAG: VOC family protein [Actinomycetota bacterium]|jgi:catechol 2,3-dioxygenase-like lactoylglutathione lyase family enzyme
MGVQLGKDSIDLGILVNDADAALAFYRDTLGFEPVGETPLPGGLGTMYRLMCGTTLIKLLRPTNPLPALAAPGGLFGAYGFRYFTITVTNLAEITAACEAAGYQVVVPIRESRPGVTISMVADPEGNWVEFLQVG